MSRGKRTTAQGQGNMDLSLARKANLRKLFKGIAGQQYTGPGHSWSSAYREDGSKKTKPPHGKRVKKRRQHK